ncbi:MAG: ATP synthase F1 subunit epsilon [Deltaproteobacteria bacterium]|nr:ATP synthase F1 subunit epsilon [Deltaproteobacteria bacterium]
MKLKVCTPEKLLLEAEVDSVTLPGSLGQMTILPKHAAFVSTLGSGNFYYRVREKKHEGFYINEGFVEVLKDVVTIATKEARASESAPSSR